MQIVLDIETIPSQHPDALTQARATIAPPATLKKPESIAAWWEHEADAAAQAAWRKQALDGGLHGEIISISACTPDCEKVWGKCRAVGESEADLLRGFFAEIEVWERSIAERLPHTSSAWPLDPVWPIAHNAAFDLGFLWRRARVLGVAVPRWLPSPMGRAGKDYGCTMQTWAGFGNRVTLDALCRALGVASPKEGGIDGSKVFDAWLQGRRGEIEAYNTRDAIATAMCWTRLTGWFGTWAA